MSVFLVLGRCAAQGAVAVASEAQEKTGLFNRFKTLDIGLIDLPKLPKSANINLNLSSSLFQTRYPVG